MARRHPLGALAVLVALLVYGINAAGLPPAKPASSRVSAQTCDLPAGTKVIMTRGSMSLASRRARNGTDQRVWACVAGERRRLLLFHGTGDVYGGIYARGFALSGDYAAFTIDRFDHYGNGEVRLRVVNVRARRTRSDALLNHVASGQNFKLGPLAFSAGGVVSVRSSISDFYPGAGTGAGADTIQLVDGNLSRTLDVGSLRSLSNPVIAGTAVSWTHGGHP